MLKANLEALQSLHAALGKSMIEGTYLADELKVLLAKTRDQLTDEYQKARRILGQCEERVHICRTKVQNFTEQYRFAQKQLEVAIRELQVAEAQLRDCYSAPYDEEYGAPDCSGYVISVQNANQQVVLAQRKVAEYEQKVDRAQEALNRASTNFNKAHQACAEIQRRMNDFYHLDDKLQRIFVRFDGVFNYRIPQLRDRLGYKIGVLETQYLLSIHGGPIASDHQSYSYARSRREFLKQAVYDYRIPSHIRGEIRHNINRPGSYIRSPMGHDVGHRFPGINEVYNYRIEDRERNRWRGAAQRR